MEGSRGRSAAGDQALEAGGQSCLPPRRRQNAPELVLDWRVQGALEATQCSVQANFVNSGKSLKLSQPQFLHQQ